MWGRRRRSWVGRVGGALETWSWTRGGLKRGMGSNSGGDQRMRLYHITSEMKANSILNEGFKLKESQYIQANGNGIYLTDKDFVSFWFGVLSSDVYKDEKTCVLECEIDNSFEMLELDTYITADEFSMGYKNVRDWYFSNKEEIDLLISKNKRLLSLAETYNEKNKHYIEQNKFGFIIELYCKQHSIDGVVCNKYRLENNKIIRDYNDVTIYDPCRIQVLGKVEL